MATHHPMQTDSGEVQSGTSVEAIGDLARGFMESRVLLTAAELNIFMLLCDQPRSAAEVSARIGGSIRGVTILLDALTAMGLLSKRRDGYRLASGLESALSSTSPDSLLPMVQHGISLWDNWSHLTAVVRGGRRSRRRTGRSAAQQRAFIGAMQVRARRDAREVVAAVDPGAIASLLDVGCGPGTYAVAFLRAVPGLVATLVDLPPVLAMAREQVAREGLLHRVTLTPVDLATDPLPGGFDLAFVSAIIHMNGPEENLSLFRRLFDSLRPGGRIVIRDHVMDPDRTHPTSGALFAVNMLVATESGGTYTFDEIAEGLNLAGFVDVRLIRRCEMSSLVDAWRPPERS